MMFGGLITSIIPLLNTLSGSQVSQSPREDMGVEFVKGSDNNIYMTQGGAANLMAILGEYNYTGVTKLEGEALELYRMLYE